MCPQIKDQEQLVTSRVIQGHQRKILLSNTQGYIYVTFKYLRSQSLNVSTLKYQNKNANFYSFIIETQAYLS